MLLSSSLYALEESYSEECNEHMDDLWCQLAACEGAKLQASEKCGAQDLAFSETSRKANIEAEYRGDGVVISRVGSCLLKYECR